MAYVGVIGLIVSLLGDWADGIIARNFGEVTKLGQILDPLVDKTIWVIYGFGLGVIWIEQKEELLILIAITVVTSILLVMDMVSFVGYLGKYLVEYDYPIKKSGGANIFGKAKFWLVCIGALALLLYLMPESKEGSILVSAGELVYSYLLLVLGTALGCSAVSLQIKKRRKRGVSEESKTQRLLEKA